MLTNPIKGVRLAHHETLEEFSAHAGIHIQALYLNERGVYPNILPKLENYIVSLGEDRDTLNERYLEFQKERRLAAGDRYALAGYQLGEPRYDEGHPFVIFRESLDPGEPVSRMAFAKNFCVHPAQLHRLETGATKHLPEQLKEALQRAGLPDIVIGELESRCEEYVVGGTFREAG